jgi:hypothetical protein
VLLLSLLEWRGSPSVTVYLPQDLRLSHIAQRRFGLGEIVTTVCFAVLHKPDMLPLRIAANVIVWEDFYDNCFSNWFEQSLEAALPA